MKQKRGRPRQITFAQRCILDLYRLYAVPGKKKPSAKAIANAFSYSFQPTVGQVRYVLSRAGLRAGTALSQMDWKAQPLGQMPDGVIAKRLGTSAETVRLKRRALGIEAYQRPRPDWSLQPLGKVKDEVLAARLGVAVGAVRAARRASGLPPLGGRGGLRPRCFVKIAASQQKAWADLYLGGCSVAQIKSRFAVYSAALISRHIRAELGVARLGGHLKKERAA